MNKFLFSLLFIVLGNSAFANETVICIYSQTDQTWKLNNWGFQARTQLGEPVFGWAILTADPQARVPETLACESHTGTSDPDRIIVNYVLWQAPHFNTIDCEGTETAGVQAILKAEKEVTKGNSANFFYNVDPVFKKDWGLSSMQITFYMLSDEEQRIYQDSLSGGPEYLLNLCEKELLPH